MAWHDIGFLFRPITDQNEARRAIKYSALPMLIWVGVLILFLMVVLGLRVEFDYLIKNLIYFIVLILFLVFIAKPSFHVFQGQSDGFWDSVILTLTMMLAMPFVMFIALALLVASERAQSDTTLIFNILWGFTFAEIIITIAFVISGIRGLIYLRKEALI